MNITGQLDLNKIREIFVYDQKAPLLFNSGTFFVIFILFFAVYLLLENRNRARILYTVVFSLLFYYKSSGIYFLVLVLSTLTDYYLGNAIYKAGNTGNKSRKKALLLVSLLTNLGMLAYFKYFPSCWHFFLYFSNAQLFH
jgi:alginate O-acetyltransferase complex protein AlgI